MGVSMRMNVPLRMFAGAAGRYGGNQMARLAAVPTLRSAQKVRDQTVRARAGAPHVST
jgi:hypothetical protein